jgi:hypothetical protein
MRLSGTVSSFLFTIPAYIIALLPYRINTADANTAFIIGTSLFENNNGKTRAADRVADLIGRLAYDAGYRLISCSVLRKIDTGSDLRAQLILYPGEHYFPGK